MAAGGEYARRSIQVSGWCCGRSRRGRGRGPSTSQPGRPGRPLVRPDPPQRPVRPPPQRAPGLKWGDVDLKAGTVRIDRALTEVRGRPTWTEGKNARSRRTIPIDPTTAQHLGARRQAEERLVAGSTWVDNDLVVASRTGTVVSPGNLDQTLERARTPSRRPPADVARPPARCRDPHGPPRQRHRRDPRRRDLLGHSPDMLMRTYAHALPEADRTVTDKIAQRGADF